MFIYIYHIYIERERKRKSHHGCWCRAPCARGNTVGSQTKNLDFRGSDSDMLLLVRGGTPRSIGNSPEVRTLRFLVCGLLACGLIAGA